MAGLGYAVAAYVSTSRLHDNLHDASDVVFGAVERSNLGDGLSRSNEEHEAHEEAVVQTSLSFALLYPNVTKPRSDVTE
jgi:hypothetical protein